MCLALKHPHLAAVVASDAPFELRRAWTSVAAPCLAATLRAGAVIVGVARGDEPRRPLAPNARAAGASGTVP